MGIESLDQLEKKPPMAVGSSGQPKSRIEEMLKKLQTRGRGSHQQATEAQFRHVMNSIWEQVRPLASSTSRDFFARWKAGKAKELGSERSTRDYGDITDGFVEFLITGACADEEISRITPSDIIRFRDHLLERVAPVTANKYVKVPS